MSHGRIAVLARRGVVAVGGSDAAKFLNDLVTADITAAAPGRAVFAALLTPQGKILFDFIVFASGDGFLLDLPRAAVADLVKRLTFYRLHAKVTIADLSGERRVMAAWGGDAPDIGGIVAPDPRLAALGWRAIVGPDAALPQEMSDAGESDYDAQRIRLGVPEGSIDFAYGDAFPHDADMDQLGGVDFTKGCYVGQEVVSRMEHRGTARRRFVIAHGMGPMPQAGAPLQAGEQPIGTLMSSSDTTGLALVRLDRARRAVDAGVHLTAGGVPVTLALPDWSHFGWPAAEGQD